MPNHRRVQEEILLDVQNLSVSYGHIRAVKSISFHVKRGEIVSLLGSNGAGKTSALFGIQNIIGREGRVLFRGKEISPKKISGGTREGLVLCPENRRIFPHMSVGENLRLGAFMRGEIEKSTELVFSLFPRLKERIKQDAGSLSGGEQQMLSLGRALMSSPELLMVDEPSLGLAPVIVDEIFSVFTSLRKSMAILLVEQNAVKALKISDRAYILQTGSIAAKGRSSDLLNDDAVRKAYLGM